MKCKQNLTSLPEKDQQAVVKTKPNLWEQF